MPGVASASAARDGRSPAAYSRIVRDAVVRIARVLGVPALPYGPSVDLATQADGTAWAQEHSGPATPPTSCVITVFPAGQALSTRELRHTLVHEVTHCYQERYAPEGVGIPWLAEGSAAWVAADLEGRSTATSDYWARYVSTPRTALFRRTFSAIGFFASLTCHGVDPGPLIIPMMQTGSSAAALRVARRAAPSGNARHVRAAMARARLTPLPCQ
jgi:hypothetical protein